MGPEDRDEQPPEQDGYEKWLDETAAKKLGRIIRGEDAKPQYSPASELDADAWDAEHRATKGRL
jgi:hypothetical protein